MSSRLSILRRSRARRLSGGGSARSRGRAPGLVLALVLGLAPGAPGQAGVDPVPSLPVAPEPPPAITVDPISGGLDASTDTAPPPRAFLPAAVTLYSIGEPTAEEQLYLEHINRARANPAAEAALWRGTTDPDVLSAYNGFVVDLNLMVTQISALAPAQPLSFNVQLLSSARRHTRDMFTGAFQSHVGSDGSNPGSRITGAGYAWTTYGENVFAYARSVTHGHAGFEVDWGGGTGGMQTPPGHRQNIHNPNFREIGLGVTNGVNGSVGPQLVTQDFAARAGLTPFITGVVYYDFNSNGAYDVGEGLGGVRVDVPGSDYFAVTAGSGGYSVPVPANGTYSVTFSGPHLAATTRSVTVSGGLNAKLDWRPTYTPPSISGPQALSVGRPGAYTFAAVGGATNYQWKHSRRSPLTVVEGAEAGTNNLLLAVSAGYDVLQTTARASGNYAFRLAHPQPVDQFVTLQWLVRPGANGRLALSSRLGWSTAGQLARIQVTTNAGLSWQDLWTLAGNGTGGQTAFVRLTNSLAAYAGREIQVRFAYDHAGGTYFNQTSSGVGWYFDDISFSDCEQLVDTQVATAGGTGFTFTPAAPAEYALRVRARVGDAYLDWGPAALASASGSAPTVVRIMTSPVLAGNRASFEFAVESGSPASFTVEMATSPAGPWSPDASAVITTLVPGVRYRAQCATSPLGRCFYRIAAR